MDNFHLMMPGYGNGTTPEPMFTPAFLQSLAAILGHPVHELGRANDSTVTNWSDRVPPTDFITDGSAGVPYEDMIELCNEAQKDMWINIPALATPVRPEPGPAHRRRARPQPQRLRRVQQRELEHGIHPVFGRCSPPPQTNPLVTQQRESISRWSAQQSAYEEVLIAKIFDQVFGSQVAGSGRSWRRRRPGRISRAGSSSSSSRNTGRPSQFIYASAVAPYVGIPSGDNVAGLTLNQLFADLNQYLTSDIVPWLQSDAAVAQQYGVPLVAYEGGQGLVPGANDLNFSVMQQAQNDPRMYQLYLALMKDWQQVGGGLFRRLSTRRSRRPITVSGGCSPTCWQPGARSTTP